MGLPGALGLRHFNQRLEALTHPRIVRIDRSTGFLVLRQEHRAAGEIAVVGDGQHPTTGLFLVGRHEGPEVLRVFRIEGGERKDLVRQGFVIPEDHDTMEVAATGLAGPLVADQAGEGAGIVVALGHRVVHLPDTAHIDVIGDQGLATTGHLLDQQVEGFHPLTRVPQIVELFA